MQRKFTFLLENVIMMLMNESDCYHDVMWQIGFLNKKQKDYYAVSWVSIIITQID